MKDKRDRIAGTGGQKRSVRPPQIRGDNKASLAQIKKGGLCCARGVQDLRNPVRVVHHSEMSRNVSVAWMGDVVYMYDLWTWCSRFHYNGMWSHVYREATVATMNVHNSVLVHYMSILV